MNIKVEQLADTVKRELSVYSDKVTAATKKVIDSVTKEAVRDLKSNSPRRTGRYAANWTSTNSFENSRTKRSTVHNRKHYQLTHLLENGHVLKSGGRTVGTVTPRVHIAPVEKTVIEKLEQGIKGAAENAT